MPLPFVFGALGNVISIVVEYPNVSGNELPRFLVQGILQTLGANVYLSKYGVAMVSKERPCCCLKSIS